MPGTACREQHGKLYQASERVYEKTLRWYERSLRWVMQRRPAALAFSIAILAATVVLFAVTPKGFLPSEDNAQIFGITETIQGTSFDDMVRSEEHTSELQSRLHLVCRLLLEKKKNI